MVAVEAPGAADAYFFEVVGERNDEASVYTGGQTARLAFSVEPGWVPDDHHTAAVRDRIPSDWHVYGEGEDESFGEANQEVERVEIDGEGGKLVYLTEAAVHGEEADYRYFARVPDDPAATGTYTVGPVQVQPDNPDQIATVDVGQWMDVPGTTEDDIVIGQGT